MKRLSVTVAACLLLFSSSVYSQAAKAPVDIVNTRMQAYNNHNMALFLSVYSDEIQIYDYPNTPIGVKGKAHLKSIFSPMFDAKSTSVVIHEQIEQGRYVVNHETVTTNDLKTKYVSIYEVEAGLIKTVRFIRAD